jgi:seryl-tRNA synthetase
MGRGHQFNKVEMGHYTRPEDSDAAVEELVGKAEALVKGLGFHFRTVKLAAADCSASMARTYDIEIHIPSMEGYKEVSSVPTRGITRPERFPPVQTGSDGQNGNLYTH